MSPRLHLQTYFCAQHELTNPLKPPRTQKLKQPALQRDGSFRAVELGPLRHSSLSTLASVSKREHGEFKRKIRPLSRAAARHRLLAAPTSPGSRQLPPSTGLSALSVLLFLQAHAELHALQGFASHKPGRRGRGKSAKPQAFSKEPQEARTPGALPSPQSATGPRPPKLSPALHACCNAEGRKSTDASWKMRGTFGVNPLSGARKLLGLWLHGHLRFRGSGVPRN